MALKLTNNAISYLAANITAASTSVTLIPGDGVKFPTLGVGDWFPATLIKPSGAIEVVRVTARSTDVLTVTRAQEGTAAQSFSTGDRIELRLTAGAAQGIQEAALDGVTTLQAQVDTLSTDLDALDASTTASVTDLQTQIDNIPPAEGLPVGFGPVPWSLPTEPAGWIFADGRTLTGATPYTALRTAYIDASFPFGQDGSGNPNIPDMRGRVPAGKDNMGGTAASRLTTAGSGVDGATLGAAGGAQTHTLTSDQMPAHGHTGTAASAGAHTHSYQQFINDSGTRYMDSGDQWGGQSASTGSSGAHTHTLTINNTGGGLAHNNTQPTLVTGYIIKT